MTLPRFAIAAALALAAAGCGRSDLFGNGDDTNGCPPGQVHDINGHCVPIPNLPDFTMEMDDGGPPKFDMAGDGSSPCSQKKEICDNHVDDNCNGFTDCKDPACAGAPNCSKPGQEICNNGIDDDNNGLTDCADPACKNFPNCQPHKCDDNNPDCTDPACVGNPKCQDLVCKPTVDFGTLQKNDSKSEKVVSTVGTKDVAITPCAPGGGGMVVTEFTVASDATSVKLDFTQTMNADQVFALFRAGVNQKCDANPIGCYDPKGAPSGSNTWVLDAGHYYLVVQAFTANHQGQADVTLSTPPSKKPEICDNGIDDDGNGLIDCADPACFNTDHCKNEECVPDINVGAIVLGAPPKTADFNTQGMPNGLSLGCAGGNEKGDETVLQFTVKQTEGILMNWSQDGDHVVELFQKPPPGDSCDAIPLACYDPSGRQNDLVAWGELPPGDYLFVWKAIQPGGEGQVHVELSAYENHKVELCHNGIDDDGDGLIDCADPDCFADAGCGAPVCQPDINVGTLHINDSATVTVDTTTGILNETVSCAKGGGKAKVVQVTLAENAGMGFQCTEPFGKDNVLGLFAAAGPRDPCDKTQIDCGDPDVIPFGCNYEIPNLQPGTYYVIVEAFQAGMEAKITLTLSSIEDRALEICNNGIDDDMDGFTDCQDHKCATSPFCIAKQCVADATIDPMPVNGPSVFELVQTANKQVTAQPPCEVKPGGSNANIFINMPSTANLQVDYAQVGSHVFAVYPYLGPGLVCEAAKPVACVASGGKQAGTAQFPNLAQGKYWFIVAADQPGDEGSASLKFTATK